MTHQDIPNQIGDLAAQVKSNSEKLAELTVSIQRLTAIGTTRYAALERDGESARARHDRMLNRFHNNVMRIYYSTCCMKRDGRTPLIEDFAEAHNYLNLDEIDDATYTVLIRRHFNAAVAEAYATHRISMRLYMALVHYFDEYADRKPLVVTDEMAAEAERVRAEQAARAADWQSRTLAAGEFRLRGHRELQGVLTERVAEPAKCSEPYARLGLDFPRGFILEGPRGCGKTHAVESLARHLGWDTVHLYLAGDGHAHSAQRCLNDIKRSFREAAACAPCILAIEEMGALRTGTGAEALDCLLEGLRTAGEKRILVVGMTDRADALAPAILHAARLGRRATVGMPTPADVEEVLAAELVRHPHVEFNLRPYAEALSGKPMSDAVCAVAEAVEHAARRRGKRIEESDLTRGIEALQSRRDDEPFNRA